MRKHNHDPFFIFAAVLGVGVIALYATVWVMRLVMIVIK